MHGLVGDIGGTHARFALVEGAGGAISAPKTYVVADYPTALEAIQAYLAEATPGRRPASAVLAVAGPVTDGAIDFTNSDWALSEKGLRGAGFRTARLINDFAAQALGAPRVKPSGLRRIGPDIPAPKGETLAILGPGTGFGVSALAHDGRNEVPMATEGGHIGFAPTDEVEVEIWRRLAKRRGRVSIERILSGAGLHELYTALADIEGSPAALADERQVQQAAETGDALAGRTLDRFCAILGSTAGDIALVTGARGGVYVTGGVAQKLADRIVDGPFRRRFEDKGRFEPYMQAIATWLITEPYTALIGAASLLQHLEDA